VLGIAQLVDGHDPRPPAFSTPCSSRTETFLDALADEVALHLGKGGLNLQESAACGGRRIHRRVEGPELDAPRLKPIDQRNEIVGEPPETIEIEYVSASALAVTPVMLSILVIVGKPLIVGKPSGPIKIEYVSVSALEFTPVVLSILAVVVTNR
jgi:hypothetical protein